MNIKATVAPSLRQDDQNSSSAYPIPPKILMRMMATKKIAMKIPGESSSFQYSIQTAQIVSSSGKTVAHCAT